VVFGPKYHWWKQIQIWILTCWFFKIVGILLGSWWAYHELGWGAWWFWDHVENAYALDIGYSLYSFSYFT
jgi:cytochrome c-type biogenesis protein CcmF